MQFRLIRQALAATTLALFATGAHAVPTFGVKASGNDLAPVSQNLSDGGPGSVSASVGFTTFRAQAGFDPMSTYLPVLKAESTGLDALFDDDRTQARAESYQVFTSAVAQTIVLDIQLDSVVTNLPAGGGLPEGTSSVLSDIFVIGGPGFGLSDTFCSGRFTFDGVYLCGSRIATSSTGLNFSNLFNGGDDPLRLDTLTFEVGAGASFGIYGRLSAGSFRGTADAFNTLTMTFQDDANISPSTVPGVASVTAPPVLALVILGMAGLLRRRT